MSYSIADRDKVAHGCKIEEETELGGGRLCRKEEWSLFGFLSTEAPGAEGGCRISRGCGKSLD